VPVVAVALLLHCKTYIVVVNVVVTSKFLLMLMLHQNADMAVTEAAAVSCLAYLSHSDQHTHVHIIPLSNEAEFAVADAASICYR